MQAHSLTSRGKLRGKGLISSSPSTNSIKSWNCPPTDNSQTAITKSESLKNRRNLAASQSTSSFNNSTQSNQQHEMPCNGGLKPSMSLNDVPLSPNTIDERYERALKKTYIYIYITIKINKKIKNKKKDLNKKN